MDEQKNRRLKIDKGFRDLIQPLTKSEFRQLEESILQDGCREAILLWRGYIIDGHNRYAICRKHKIPFHTHDVDFNSREEIIQWICKNQLDRKNISEKIRKYLIGVQYNTERIMNQQKNDTGLNQYSPSFTTSDEPIASEKNNAIVKQVRAKNLTADRIAADNHVSRGTVLKYAAFSRAVDTIKEKCPELFPKLLSGYYKISHDNLVSLAQLPTEEIRRIAKKMERPQQAFMSYKNTRKEITKTRTTASAGSAQPTEVFEEYNPGVEAIELCRSIPAWISTLSLACKKTDFGRISDHTRDQLMESLNLLYIKTLEAMSIVER